MRTVTAGALALAFALSSSPSALAAHGFTATTADQAGPGFELSSIPMPTGFPAFGTVTCTLPGGDVVTFDGQNVERWTAAGAFVQDLGSVAQPGYASFALPMPGGGSVIVAHSGDFFGGVAGRLYRVPLSGTGPVSLAQITFAYDAVFLPNGKLLVSADTSGR